MAELLSFEPSTRPRRHVDKSGEKPLRFVSRGNTDETRQTALETLRKACGLTVYEISKKSRIGQTALKKILDGRTRHPHKATLARIEGTFRGLVAKRHRAVMKEIRRAEHGPVIRLDAADFSLQRPRDRAWLDDVRVRGLATYIMACELGYPAAILGKALHVSRTAISKTVSHWEDWRDRRRTERIIAAVKLRLERGH
jgi:hypothetical protein